MIYSRQRELIYHTLCATDTHPTADELFAMLKPAHPELSLATVYRNLNQLAEGGLALKIPVAGGADRFDGMVAGHHHMVCAGCGRMVDLPESFFGGMEFPVKESGHTVEGCRVLFYGTCQSCKSSEH